MSPCCALRLGNGSNSCLSAEYLFDMALRLGLASWPSRLYLGLMSFPY